MGGESNRSDLPVPAGAGASGGLESTVQQPSGSSEADGTSGDPTLPAPTGPGAWSATAALAPAPGSAADGLATPFHLLDPLFFKPGTEIARGGMGRVIYAFDARLRRQVAIKELLHDNPEIRARFEREALITAGLQHPSIVNIIEAGRYADGRPFYAMKLVSGRPLDREAALAKTFEARLALLPKVIAVVEALAYAHSRRVIHRDLKPGNVLVGEFGEIVVIDWGLAKHLSEAEVTIEARAEAKVGTEAEAGTTSSVDTSETRLGSVMGTPAYMPPEQAAGATVDERADVYALGAMLYSLLAGDPLFVGASSAALLQAVLAGPPPALETREPRVPPDLRAIVAKAMARAPEERYPTARELSDDLKRFQTGKLVGVHHYTLGEMVRRFVRRNLAVLAVVALALLVLAVGGTLAIVKIVREKHEAQAASAEANTEKLAAEAATANVVQGEATLQEEKGRQAILEARAQSHQAGTFASAVKPTPAKDYQDALTLEQAACTEGNAAGCRDLGEMYDHGEGVTQDFARSRQLYESACADGNARGCTDLGYVYESGEGGVAKDYVKAVSLFQTACDATDANGCSDLGAMYYQGTGVAQDGVKAVALFQKGCDLGDSDGCLNLGAMYAGGTGVTQDTARAISLYKTSCDGGDVRGCFDLGTMYANGNGVAADPAQAIALYQKACDGGFGPGCNDLGLVYAGEDTVKAAGLFRQACDDGEANGCNNLGAEYSSGGGLPEDDAAALALFGKACDGGCAAGCDSLGDVYRLGQGVPKDAARAKALYAQACQGGVQEACGK
jgi:TPR repeat protein